MWRAVCSRSLELHVRRWPSCFSPSQASCSRLFVSHSNKDFLHHRLLELEARALHQAMKKKVCGAAASMNTHHLFLCDNMAVTLSFDCFRAVSKRLSVQVRRFASLAMCMGIRPHVRWVPSELSPADPSRKQVANINSPFLTSALAQVGNLNFRDTFQDEVGARADKNTIEASFFKKNILSTPFLISEQDNR